MGGLSRQTRQGLSLGRADIANKKNSNESPSILDCLHTGSQSCRLSNLRQRVIVVNDSSGVIELINPTITKASEETGEIMEGSIAPGAPRGTVTRPKNVTISAFDRNGSPVTISGSDFLAAAFCHEIDHLDGIMFTDKLKTTIKYPIKEK